MNKRHVRSVAVFAVVLVALTGARRGGDGGGCEDGSGSSSSSSSSSGSYDGGSGSDVGKDDYDGGSTSGGSSTGTSTGATTGGSRTDRAERDIRITDCVIDGVSTTTADVTWKYTITNSDTTGSASYSGTFSFKDNAGLQVGTSTFTEPEVPAGQPVTGEVSDVVTDDDVSTLRGRCYVDNATKAPAL